MNTPVRQSGSQSESPGGVSDPLSAPPRRGSAEQTHLARALGECREALRLKVTESPLSAHAEISRLAQRKPVGARLHRLIEVWTRAFEELQPGIRPSRADRLRCAIASIRWRCTELLRTVDFPAPRLRSLAARIGDHSSRLDAVLRDIDAGGHEPARRAEFEIRRRSLMKEALENARDLYDRVAEIRRALEAYEDAKRALMQGSLGLVVLIARQQSRGIVPLPDLIQEGNVGLLEAADRFDPYRGFQFTTYAKWWIHNGIREAQARQSGAISVPPRLLRVRSKVRSVADALAHRLERRPELEEISREAGVSLREARQAMGASMLTVSLHGLRSGGDRIPGLRVDRSAPEGLDPLLHTALLDLPSRDREVIQLRFGMHSRPVHSRLEIARLFDLSRERVRQIEVAALRKLRHALRAEL
jgi:RNA polymerase sigma factor (sigma-70 family)